MKNNRQLTLQEKWEIDIEAAKNGGTLLTLVRQCEKCKNNIPQNTKNCKRYQDEIQKPSFVRRCSKECSEFEHIKVLLMKSKTKSKTQMLGGIFGFAVGDALGVPLEFSSRDERKKDPVHEMRAYGTYHQPFGTWSDDTSLTLCLLDSLRDGYDIKDIGEKASQYLYESLWTPYGEVFDIGNTTLRAIDRKSVV